MMCGVPGFEGWLVVWGIEREKRGWMGLSLSFEG